MLAWVRPEPLVAVLLWSGIFVTVKVGLREIPFLSFTELRLAVAAVLLLLIAHQSLRRPLSRRIVRLALIAGAPQLLFQVLLFMSLVYTSASNSALLFATAPILLGLGLWLGRGERPSGQRLAGLVLGVVGVALVVKPGGDDAAADPLLGGMLAIASAGAWAWYGVAIRPLVSEVGSLFATALAVVVAAIYLLPFSVWELSGVSWASVTWLGWGALLYNAVLGSVVAMTLWGRALAAIGPVRTMVYTYLEPVLAVILAAVLLSERLDPLAGLGAIVIIVAIWLSDRG